ncbi:MAG: LysR family transcriptional regulator [Fibrobacteria bacterium]
MEITNNDIVSLDLNLLRLLDTVLREGSATGAARRLHVTQSAVSNSLARLRQVFGDPLAVRDGRGLSPTPFARRLMPRLSAALAQVDAAVLGQLGFDAMTTRRRFTLACTDAHHFHDVPSVASRFAHAFPRAELRIVSPDFLESSDGLATGEIDAALLPRQGVPEGQPCEDLYQEGFAFVVRKGHPVAGKLLATETFNRLRHIDTLIVQGRGGIGHRVAGDAFARLGLVRDVALSVPSFGAAALAAAQSDLIAGIPERLAGILCRILPLRKVRSPWPAPSFPMTLTWNASTDADAGSRCFRAAVINALKRQRRQPSIRPPA